MAATDRAIIVGIQKYPSLGELSGPENDALAFSDWVQSPGGGAVPAENVWLLLAKIPNPYYSNPVRPVYWEIEDAFGRLMDLAEASRGQPGWAGKIGRRLYIYLAGHGFDPKPNFTALLGANATRQKTGFHFLGKPYAELFAQAALFEQIILLIDCCRERDFFEVALNMPRLRVVVASPEERDKVGWFHAFAGRWTRKTRERPLPPPDPVTKEDPVRGVFTKALLVGLEGGAADPATGYVTCESLGDFLIENTRTYLDEADRNDPDIAQIPEVDYDPKDKGMILVTVKVQQYPVTIHPPPGAAGGLLTILGDRYQPVGAPAPMATAPAVVQLPRGTYQAQFPGAPSKVFEVTGTGAVDVTL
jgi:hypothetical protein